MKWNNRAKLTATATSALLFTMLLVGCSNNNNSNNVQLPVNSQIEQEQTDTIDNNQVVDEDENKDSVNQESEVEANESDNNATSDAPDEISYEATGIYVGAIDNNSIEVTINGEPTVFQIPDSFNYVIDEYDENAKVTIKYTKLSIEDGKYVQNIVNDITIAK